MVVYPDEIEYTETYSDDLYVYRHVTLNKPAFKKMFQLTKAQRLLKEFEWRDLGVQQRTGMEHYTIHRREPHILLFRKPLDIDPNVAWHLNRERVLCQYREGYTPCDPSEIVYTALYNDDLYEYRNVILPETTVMQMIGLTKGKRLIEDSEWRKLRIQQSRGWVHCETHQPGSHILLFRRPHGTDPKRGLNKSIRKVFTLELSPSKGDDIDIACTGLSGDVMTFTMPRLNSMMELMEVIANRIEFPRELLILMLPSGACVDEPNCCTPLEDFVSGHTAA